MFSQILVLWDGSQLCERAFAIAKDLGATYEAKITAVYVAERSRAEGHVHLTTRGHLQSHGPIVAADQIQSMFTQQHAGSAEDGVETDFCVVHGDDVVMDLLGFAHERGADLIVVGHHPDTSPHYVTPHGVTQRLLLEAHLPVLVVGQSRD